MNEVRSSHRSESNRHEQMKSMKNTYVYMHVFVCVQIRMFICDTSNTSQYMSMSRVCFLSYQYALYAWICPCSLHSLRCSSLFIRCSCLAHLILFCWTLFCAVLLQVVTYRYETWRGTSSYLHDCFGIFANYAQIGFYLCRQAQGQRKERAPHKLQTAVCSPQQLVKEASKLVETTADVK